MVYTKLVHILRRFLTERLEPTSQMNVQENRLPSIRVNSPDRIVALIVGPLYVWFAGRQRDPNMDSAILIF